MQKVDAKAQFTESARMPLTRPKKASSFPQNDNTSFYAKQKHPYHEESVTRGYDIDDIDENGGLQDSGRPKCCGDGIEFCWLARRNYYVKGGCSSIHS
jgi:hypothetical protein